MVEKVVDRQRYFDNDMKESNIDKYIYISETRVYDMVKRVIDIIIGALGCILLLPLTILIKLINLLCKDNGKVIYTQLRIGKDGKEFKLYKYRTMVENADEVLNKILEENPELKAEYKANKKIKEDPRITKSGKIIRKMSIDEIPQFFNILKGDMSFIGNRPYLPREKEDMKEYYNDIIQTKPGLTGMWQTSGRSSITFERRLEIEQEYSKKYCFKLDILIFFKTITSVFKGM